MIVQYNNRKYYNTITHKYLTFKQMLELSREKDFKVMRHDSAEDITYLTKLKLIVSLYPNKVLTEQVLNDALLQK